MFMQPAARFIPTESAVPPPMVRAGLIAPTLVETEAGWCPAGALRCRHRVCAFDGGLREIVSLDRDWLMPGSVKPVHLQGGRLGSASDTLPMPDQALLIDTRDALPDAVVALVAAAATVGAGASLRANLCPMEVVVPVFEDEEVIYANGGLLLHFPGSRTVWSQGILSTSRSYPRPPSSRANDDPVQLSRAARRGQPLRCRRSSI